MGRPQADADQTPTKLRQTSLAMRRERIIGDIRQLMRDAEHWNRRNPTEEPIQLYLDELLAELESESNTPKESV